jgi:hypothetical protein
MDTLPGTRGLQTTLLAAGAMACGPAEAVAFHTFEGTTLTNEGLLRIPPLVPTGFRGSGFFGLPSVFCSALAGVVHGAAPGVL